MRKREVKQDNGIHKWPRGKPPGLKAGWNAQRDGFANRAQFLIAFLFT